MRALVFLLKLLLKIVMAPVSLALTLFVWICVGVVYVSGLVLGLINMVIALLGVAVLLTCSLQNGIILLPKSVRRRPYILHRFSWQQAFLSMFLQVLFYDTPCCSSLPYQQIFLRRLAA